MQRLLGPLCGPFATQGRSYRERTGLEAGVGSPAQQARMVWRNQRCAGSLSKRGCQACITRTLSSGTGISNERSGRPNLVTLPRMFAGIGRIRSDSGNENIAEWKLGVISATLRCTPWAPSSTSMGPLARPRRDTLICG